MINWIKISDKLPKNDRDVIVINKRVPYTLMTAFYMNGRWHEPIVSNLIPMYTEYNFTHWAELSDINLPE